MTFSKQAHHILVWKLDGYWVLTPYSGSKLKIISEIQGSLGENVKNPTWQLFLMKNTFLAIPQLFHKFFLLPSFGVKHILGSVNPNLSFISFKWDIIPKMANAHNTRRRNTLNRLKLDKWVSRALSRVIDWNKCHKDKNLSS